MDMMERRRRIVMSQPHIVTLSGGLVHFESDTSAPLTVIAGSGNITLCGKNLFNLWANGYWLSSNKSWVSSSSGAVSRPIKVSPGMVVTLSQTNSSATYQFHEWRKSVAHPKDYTAADNLAFVTSASGAPKTYTVQYDSYLTVFANVGNDGASNRHVQLEVGSSPSQYEAYSGSTASAGTPRTSLVGINNLWSDSGDISITYWAH